MANQSDGKRKQKTKKYIPRHWRDERTGQSVNVCGKVAPEPWTTDYKQVTCADCNVIIIGY